MPKNCWEFKQCGREPGGVRVQELGVCPAATSAEADGSNNGKQGGRICWILAGTLCQGQVQGSFASKVKSCVHCDFYRKVREEEGFKFDMGTELLTVVYSPKQLAQAYEQLQYALEHMKELESQLYCDEKVASVGRLAAGIAHEINNPLAFVLSNLSALSDYNDIFKMCLKKYLQVGELLKANALAEAQDTAIQANKLCLEKDLVFLLGDVESLMSQSMEGLYRVRDIVRNLKDFSKADNTGLVAADINAEIQHALAVIGGKSREN